MKLLAPFRCDLGFTRRQPAARPAEAPKLHPIHRALAWQRRLDRERDLNRLTLAREEGIAPGSVTHYLKLLNLAPDIRTKLLELTSAADVRRFSLNRMKALAALPPEEQQRRFAAITAVNGSASKGYPRRSSSDATNTCGWKSEARWGHFYSIGL